jgi:predicted deacylase
VEFAAIDVSEKMKELTLADEDVPLVHELDLDKIPAGRISKLWVVLFEDALKPMAVPVIIAKGCRPGPVVGMTSSLHGDEVNGVRVIHRLFQTELDPESLHGTVVAVIVANVQGFLAGTRGMDGQDLNRLMPGYQLCYQSHH